MTPDPDTPGMFQADWNAEKPGSYITEVIAQRGGQELGRDVLTFQRMDGVAENFHTEQNRDLLEKLASETGGRYWTPQDLSKLPARFPIPKRESPSRNQGTVEYAGGFSSDSGAAFPEWLLRRRWGIV